MQAVLLGLATKWEKMLIAFSLKYRESKSWRV